MTELTALLVASTLIAAACSALAALADHAPAAVAAWRRWRTPRAQVLQHPTATATPPPGQLGLWRLDPRTRPPRWLRTVAPDGTRSDPIRDLPVAAGRAALLAAQAGEAWLIADDHTYAHVTATGVVTPTLGWPALAGRVIHTTKRKVPTS